MSLERVAAALEARLPGAVTRSASVADLTTYRVGGAVAVLVRVTTEAALAEVATVVRTEQPPLLIVGRGSNLLVADDGFEGLAVTLEGDFEHVELDGARGVVRAGAGVALPVLARRAAAVGLTGLEFFVGIPGSVGGAVRMNAGGHGRETREVLRHAWIVDLAAAGAAPERRASTGLDLTYRHSNIAADEIVIRAEFEVAAEEPAACAARLAEVVRWRREHQPGGSNAGSVFRNPLGDSAGRLIDAAGLKGLRVGGAMVSEKHANFFQAEPGATAADVARLVEMVRERVAATTGVYLEPELCMVGFAPVDAIDRSPHEARRSS